VNIARPPVYFSSRRFRTWGRASLVGFVGMITRSIPPRLCRSSRPQAQSRRDTKSPHELRFRDGALPSVSARGRRGAYGASVLGLPVFRKRALVKPPCLVRPLSFSGFCCGPRYAAIWRPRAVAISHRLAVLATKPVTPAAADYRLRMNSRWTPTPNASVSFRARPKAESRNL
jgi:hypothetical protein